MTDQTNDNESSAYQMAIRRRNLVLFLLFLFVLVISRPTFFERQKTTVSNQQQTLSQQSSQAQPAKKNNINSTPKRMRGIDVSHYQGDIDWDKLSQEQLHFIFIKATQGLYFVDPTFEENTQGARVSGLLHGAYHFFEPSKSAIAQAEFFLKVTGVQHQLPPVLDIEIAQGLDKNKITSAAKIWLDKVESQTGCRPIIYSSLDFWKAYLSEDLSDYPLWVAEYEQGLKRPSGKESWIFWQTTNTAHIEGIDSSVDLNLSFLTLTELEKLKCPVS